MSRGKHTACSQCRSVGEYQALELMWRLALRGPWHYVVGWWCAACRNALLQLVGYYAWSPVETTSSRSWAKIDRAVQTRPRAHRK
jgi:hypothetical protein